MSTLTHEDPSTRDADWSSGATPTRSAKAQEVADLAYRYWVERQKKGAPGSDIGDWLRAEAELIRRRDAAVDEASEESFPASDSPGW